MANLEVAIRAKEEQIRQLQADLAVLRRARELCGSVVAAQGVAQTTSAGVARAFVVKADSQIGKALSALRAADRPLHIDELMEALQKRGEKLDKVSLVGTLSRMVKAGRLVDRVGPNTFGLLEWRRRESAATMNGTETDTKPDNGTAALNW